MTEEIFVHSGSILGIYGDTQYLIDYFEIENEQEIEFINSQKEIFPLDTIDQKTIIPSEANKAYESQIPSKGITFLVVRDEDGDVGALGIDGDPNNFYLPGSVLTIPGSSIGGTDVTDDIVIRFLPNNGMVFDTSNDFAILNNVFLEFDFQGYFGLVDRGIKAQILSKDYSKTGEIFNLEPNFSYEFFTTEPEIEGCDRPPYFCNTDVNPSCVRDLSYAWADCNFINSFPLLNTSNANNFEGTWLFCSNLSSSPDAEDIPGSENIGVIGFFSTVNCENVTLNINITPDPWPQEVTWQLFKEEILVESGDVEGAEIQLPDCGDYIFKMRDSFGDGGGPYNLELDGTFIYESNGGYGFGEDIPFTVNGYTPLINEINSEFRFLPLELLSITYTVIVEEALNTYDFPIITDDKKSIFCVVSRDAEGEINTVLFISILLIDEEFPPEEEKDEYEEGDTILVPGSLIGGEDDEDDLIITIAPGSLKTVRPKYSFPTINTSNGTNFDATWAFCSSLTTFPLLDVSNGTNFSFTWEGCTSLTTFPLLDVSNGTNFLATWSGCSSLTTFPAGMFDNCEATNFEEAWTNCALTQQSVDNILVSLDTAGQEDGIVSINLGISDSPSQVGLDAITSLESKGWTVFTN